jgi:hypothetical protein
LGPGNGAVHLFGQFSPESRFPLGPVEGIGTGDDLAACLRFAPLHVCPRFEVCQLRLDLGLALKQPGFAIRVRHGFPA